MAPKSHRKLQQQVDRTKAVREKDLGVRLMVFGPILTYVSLTFLITPQTGLPNELFYVGVVAGFIVVFVGTLMVERAFRRLLAGVQ